MHWKLRLSVAVLAGALAGCAQEPAKPSETHLGVELLPPPVAGAIPPPVQIAPVLPKPEPKPAPETYSVVVNGVPAQELLFALARDARSFPGHGHPLRRHAGPGRRARLRVARRTPI